MNTINLNNFSRENITFLKDVNKSINFSLKGEFKYSIIKDFDIRYLNSFIDNLTQDSVYTVIPFVSTTCVIGHPFITLSRQFLVTKDSNPTLLNEFIRNQFLFAINE
jgi:hypothetical protein